MDDAGCGNQQRYPEAVKSKEPLIVHMCKNFTLTLFFINLWAATMIISIAVWITEAGDS